MLPLYFARRYLFSKKSHSVINIIAGVSLFAIAMPVAAMIILLSVFNGFENLIKEMATAFDAEITITAHE
ncbi:MAG: ABC transporter permease, partial [Alistipes sp.]|nr:ABC transporter permease [Alistipes sp.]